MTAIPIPVILDTDIGGDIDDTWALAMLLKSPELDVKLVVSDTGDTEYRARIIAKLHEVARRTDIPVGIGKRFESDGPREKQAAWVRDYSLASYPGTVYEDGVQAIIDTIMNSPEPVTIICIGPMPNLLEALQREPGIAQKAHFVGMLGSFHKHHQTNQNNRKFLDGAIPEWNVIKDIAAAKAVFTAPWLSLTITPTDTCGNIMFEGERYQRLRDSDDKVMKAVMDNYRIWSPCNEGNNPETHSSVLFDTVAVYLAFTTEFIEMQTHGVRIDDEGYTRIDPEAQKVNVAMNWTDLEAYYDFLEKRLLAPVVEPK
ncbi:MAG: nucleoside hydrolase [Planctomycetes bacterium]|nr:nucleoside hydrolase [Planctomycetota bacterium]